MSSKSAKSKRILVVEDDSPLAEVISYNLRQSGYQVFVVDNGDEAIQRARLAKPDLMLLDVMLPGIDGIEICRLIRADATLQHIPVIMLTAKGEEADQLVGFAVGADDYVSKPFSVRVLLERIKAQFRRQRLFENRQIYENRGIAVDTVQHRVTVDEQEIDLTPSEFGILAVIMKHPGRVFTRTQLIDDGLGGDSYVLERTIDVHIRSLRHKLGQRGELIETVRGVGYRFRREDPNEEDSVRSSP